MIKFVNIPSWNDPRLKVLCLQTTFVLLGITHWGFNRSPQQVLLIIVTCAALDIVLHYFLRRQEILFPLSACVTGMGLSILTNFAHGLWYAIIPPFFAITSKYLFTVKNNHVYNPALFGVVASLLLANGMITPSPAYQWGGSGITAFFIVTAALMLFALKIQRTALIISFLLFYALQLCAKAWITRYHLPPETWFMGALSSPAFYLFTFFMITDPKTSPDSRSGQILMSLLIVGIDLILHMKHSFATLFYSGFIYFSLRWAWMMVQSRPHNFAAIFKSKTKAIAAVCLIGLCGWTAHAAFNNFAEPENPGFSLVSIETSHSGITGRPSDILTKTDPKLAHVAKWLLSVGDAAAISDVNQDGLQDVFLTQPLKSSEDRAQLYLNQGNFRFAKFDLPQIDPYRLSPETYGLITDALWFDLENDGDRDLLLSVGFGKTILLKNRLKESGVLDFEDISTASHLDDYTLSITSNVLDMNQDGFLDIIVGNVMSINLPDYAKPTPFNIFNLPEPEHEGDRRMVNIMHRTWYNANNGDRHFLYLSRDGHDFEKVEDAKTGFEGTRWTLDIATGDLNADGWPDLYIANDFGPDELYFNEDGKKFRPVKGALVGTIGHDTYKGMNASFGDLDENGLPDIYVSNVHVKLQAEGSLLWMNKGDWESLGPESFHDQAASRNALNERRFGWGGALGDMNRDGRLDILQANGMMDDAYDKKSDPCPDYWYWNAQVALTNPDVHGYADRWADLRGRCIYPKEANRVYLNLGNYFVDVAEKIGWSEKGNSRGIALGDLDNDGDLDSIVTHMTAPPSLYRNESEDRNWIGLSLAGDGKICNRDALGTKVVLSYEENGIKKGQHREIYASNGLSAQNDPRILFGLGDWNGAEVKAEITWCGRGKPVSITLPVRKYNVVSQDEDR